MKLCKDCKWYEESTRSYFDKCKRLQEVEMVRGKEEPRFCLSERISGLEEYCGRDARFFESREAA